MFHTLALVEIKNSCSEKFLESLLQITFIDSHFPAEFADSERFSDMFQQDFPGQINFFPVRSIGQEFTLEGFHFSFTQHTFQTIKQQHLCLSVDENILQAISIIVVQQPVQHHADTAAKR